MRLLAMSMMMGSLVLIGAMPESVGQSISSNTYLHLADASRPPNRDAYMRQVENEMQAWRQKLHDFSDREAVEGKKTGIAAEDELHSAWMNTEVEANKLQTAGTASWDSAKISYENASHGLAAAWDRIRSADK
jgi:hypothetical protein